MCRALALALLLSLLLVSAVSATVDRIVVMEHFTNAGCSYCATYDPYIKAFVENHKDQIVVIQYHAWWPWSNDPFYRNNTADNTARINFYNVTGVPHIILDGRDEPVYPYTPSNLEAAWPGVYSVPTELVINVRGHFDPAKNGTGTVMADIIATEELTGAANDLRVMMAICEDGIHYSAPNGVSLHNWVMLDVFQSTEGVPISFSGTYPETVHVEEPFVLDSWASDDSCYVAVWVQNFGSRAKIKQGSKTKLEKFSPTAVASNPEGEIAPRALGQNFPNPCNPATTIPLTLARGGAVTLGVYDVEGRRVRSLVESVLPAGNHEIEWDGLDNLGHSVASGIYYCRFAGEGVSEARKMVVIR